MSKFSKFFIFIIVLTIFSVSSAFAVVTNPIRSAIRNDSTRLYLSAGTDVVVEDISDPESPSSVNSLSLGATIADIITYEDNDGNNYLFVSTLTGGGTARIYIYDINSDPTSYSARITLPSGTSPRGIAVTTKTTLLYPGGSTTTGYLYVSDANGGDVYKYSVTGADFLDSSNYSLSNTYSTGSAGLYGLALKPGSRLALLSSDILYVSNRTLGQILKIDTGSGSVTTLASDATDATYLTLSDDKTLLFARVLQSDDTDLRVFLVSDDSEITDMAVALGGSSSVYSDCNYEGIVFENDALYLTKYDTDNSLEKLYKYTPSATPETEGWDEVATLETWTPGATDSLVVATSEAGYPIWRTYSDNGSYALITVEGEATGEVASSEATIELTHNEGTSNIYWISIPYTNDYNTASGLIAAINTAAGNAEDSGELITEVGRWDGESQIYEPYSYLDLGEVGTWGGTDFDIISGEALYLSVAADATITLIGVFNLDFNFSLTHNEGVGNIRWISLPYDAGYTDAHSIITDLNSKLGEDPESGAYVTEIGRFTGDTQAYESYSYLSLLDSWDGENFDFTPGEGYYITIAQDLTWTPEYE